MSRTFSIPFKGSSDAVFNKAKKAVVDQDGSFKGDVKNGGSFALSIMGRIAGTYRFENNNLVVTIVDKPFLIGYGIIEDTLRKKIAE